MNGPEKPNAVIWYLAIRPSLKLSLELLYKNFNKRYKYPVLVFTFGKQYGERFIRDIHTRIDPGIRFMEIPPLEVSPHIREEELFYNRKEIPYVREFFPKSRIGFLHMCQFVTGEVMGHPEIDKYDYVLKLDDDHFFVEEIDFDFFKFMQDNDYKFGPFGNIKADYERARQTQIGLRELAKAYVKEQGVVPKSASMDKEGNWDSAVSRDPTIWDMSIFKNQNWKKWWNRINESGGIYKYRWGDLEIHSLYMRMYYPDSAWHNFDFYGKGKCVHGGHGPVFQRSPAGTALFFCKRVYKKLLGST